MDSKEAGTSLKCQRHHNSRGAKERLLAVAEPAKKGSQSLDEQIKVPSTAPCTRLSRVEGAIGDPGWTSVALYGNKRRRAFRSLFKIDREYSRDSRFVAAFVLWLHLVTFARIWLQVVFSDMILLHYVTLIIFYRPRFSFS